MHVVHTHTHSYFAPLWYGGERVVDGRNIIWRGDPAGETCQSVVCVCGKRDVPNTRRRVWDFMCVCVCSRRYLRRGVKLPAPRGVTHRVAREGTIIVRLSIVSYGDGGVVMRASYVIYCVAVRANPRIGNPTGEKSSCKSYPHTHTRVYYAAPISV